MSELEAAAAASVGCAGCAALREELRRANARAAALAEESEKLRSERDGLQQLLEEARADLQATAEEMAAAARFSEKEWREACRKAREFVDKGFAAALELLSGAEAAARQKLQDEEEAQRCDLQGPQWEAALEEVPVREAARIEAVFAARGLPMSELRRTHLGKERTTDDDSYAAGEGLYKLFLALRPGGPVDRFAMRALLKSETDVTHVWYATRKHRDIWIGRHFTIPAADAYELAACVLCHLPALQYLGFRDLPPLSTRSLEWVSRLPQDMQWLRFYYTDYTVADLREMYRRRGDRTFLARVHTNNCTDWGEFAGVGDAKNKKTLVNEELGGMVWWYS